MASLHLSLSWSGDTGKDDWPTTPTVVCHFSCQLYRVTMDIWIYLMALAAILCTQNILLMSWSLMPLGSSF